jgi:hypothetical protein
MPGTYEPIATNTLGTAVQTVTFSSIPATYTDLRLVVTISATSGTIDTWGYFNNDTGTNYSNTRISGTGAAAGSARTANTAQNYDTNLSSITTVPCLITYDILSYAGSTFKTHLTTTSMDKNGSGVVLKYVKLWRSTAAINRIDYTAAAATTFAIGSTFTLYGIKAA